MFHIDLLTPYCETPTHGPNYQHPLPDLVDGAKEYEVKKILDSWKFSRKCKLQDCSGNASALLRVIQGEGKAKELYPRLVLQ